MATAKKTASGNWRVLAYVGKTRDGKRHYKSFTAPTRREAELQAATFQSHITTRSTMTLRDAYRAYVSERDNVLSPSTLREYERITRASTSVLMDYRIDEITTADIQAEVNDLARTHAPKTVRNRFGLFTAVMSAYRPDAVFRVKLPAKVKKDVYIPDDDAIRRIYNELVRRDSWLLVPFLFASLCGLRASEIAGLQYKHIGNGRVSIRQARVSAPTGTAIKTPKTYAGNREVPCPQIIIDTIGAGDPEEFIVKHSPWLISDSFGDFMRSTTEEYFSFHKLRHYFASRALLSGVPKRYVADLMGHASENMINQVYEHVFKNAREKYADMLSKIPLLEPNATENATEAAIFPVK